MGNYISMDIYQYRSSRDLSEIYDLYYANEAEYDPHETLMLWYDVGINRFVDVMNGNVMHDIHRILAPWQIALFKKDKTDYVFPDVTNTFLVELVYPDYMYTKHS